MNGCYDFDWKQLQCFFIHTAFVVVVNYLFCIYSQLLEDKADLYGAIMHRGTKIHRGHFFAIVRHRMQWYKVDDMRVCFIIFPVYVVKEHF